MSLAPRACSRVGLETNVIATPADLLIVDGQQHGRIWKAIITRLQPSIQEVQPVAYDPIWTTWLQLLEVWLTWT